MGAKLYVKMVTRNGEPTDEIGWKIDSYGAPSFGSMHRETCNNAAERVVELIATAGLLRLPFEVETVEAAYVMPPPEPEAELIAAE
jgi:hypothetical protein